MKNTLWILALILIIAIPVAAIPSVYESTSVSRIVGDTPLEMQNQLKRDDLDLESAGLFDDSLSPLIQSNMFNSFPQAFQQSPDDSWLQNSGKTLLVYNSQWYTNTHTSNNYITTGSLPKLSSPESLVIANTHYAGIALPKIDAFGDRLSSKTTLIAPLSRSSTRFLESVICNLGRNDGLPIGETFRLARNNYHWNTKDDQDIIGLSLLSYALYGNPFAKAEVPEFDTSARDYHCENRLADYTVSALSSSPITSTTDGFQQTHTYTIQDYDIEQTGTFEIINSADFELGYEPGELVLPYKSLIFQFPHKTIITGYDIEFSNPVDITANIPEWNGENYTNRICSVSSQNESATINQVNSPDSQIVIAKLNPIEITDCEQGSFTLYRTASITLSYYPYSPIRITSVEAPQESLPSEFKTIKVNIENTQNTPTTGTLILKNEQGIVSVNTISTTQSQHNLEIYTPAEEGTYTYTVEFVQNGDVKTSTTFTTEVSILDASLEIPDVVQDEADIDVHITNKKTTSMQSDITAYLSKDGQTISQQTQSIQLQPGENTATFTFTDLQKDDQQYDVLVAIPYENKIKTLTGKIVTNHDPSILNTNVIYQEGDTVLITPNVADADGDTIIASITDQPFELDGSHTLDYESSGEYTYTVEATDGTTTVQQTFGVLVQNTNRPPVISTPENVTGKEDQQITIQASATDPDNENSVDNDDNQLTITYDYPFDQNGAYTPTYEESGEIYVTVTASDGELSDAVLVKVVIANVNRPPQLDDLANITINEGEFVDLWKGRDPDNENNVTNDDNTLWMYFAGGPDGGPINHYGKWQTDNEDSGVYPMTVQVEDGELKAGKLITLTVQNVNRPPIITAPDVVYASGSVDLSQYITDPDNTNSVANDDNTLSVTYGSPFDGNGRWTPAQPDSAAQVTITVSDGEFSVTKTIMVMVDVVGVQPVQSPPVPTEEPEAPEPTQTQESTTDTSDPSPPIQSTPPASTPVSDPAPAPGSTPVQPTNTPAGQTISSSTQQIPQQESQPQPTPQPTSPPPAQQTTPTPQQQTQQTQQQQTAQQQQTTPTPGTLEIKVIVDSKEVDDGDSVKVKPDDEFKVKVELENNAAEAKDVDVDVKLSDFDQEESDSITLKAGESEQFKYTFDIPKLTDDDEYLLEIRVNEKKWEITLKIDKPSHEINVKANVEPEIVLCEETSAKLKVRIENTGRDDEEGTIKVESSTLKLLDEWPFDLPEGESQLFEKIINALVPGEHGISVKALYGSKNAKADAKLTVESCKKEETQNTQLAPEERMASALANKKSATPVNADAMPFEDTISIIFVVLSSIFAITLLIAIPRIFR